MADACHKRLYLLLRRVFHKKDTAKGLTIAQASSIISDVRKARLCAQTCIDAPGNTAKDRRFAQACADVLLSYQESDEVSAMVNEIRTFLSAETLCVHLNTSVIQTLSFKLLLRLDVPFEYIERRIWTTALPEFEIDDGSVPSESGDENRMINIFIDIESVHEDRIVPAPTPPSLTAYQISQLQTCLQQLQHMCFRLPEALSCAVCTHWYGDYRIRPGLSPTCILHAFEIDDLSAHAQYLVAKALECGIVVDEVSAFWMSCHLNNIVSEWDAESIGSDDSISDDLDRFPEIDQMVITKFQIMVEHEKWNRGDAPIVLPNDTLISAPLLAN